MHDLKFAFRQLLKNPCSTVQPSRWRRGGEAVAVLTPATNAPSARASKTQRGPQILVDIREIREAAKLHRDGLVENRGQIVRHDDRVRPQPGALSRWRLERNENPARMVALREFAGDHRRHNLREASVQSVVLDEPRGTSFEGPIDR